METDAVNSPSDSMNEFRGDPSTNWSVEQKDIIDMNYKYYIKMVTYTDNLWSHGPDKVGLRPAVPDRDISEVLGSPNQPAKGKRSKIKIAKKTVKISEMSPQEFHQYLESYLVVDYRICPDSEVNMSTIDDIAQRVKTLVNELKKGNCSTFNKNIEIGNLLNLAYDKFMAEKRTSKSRASWRGWTVTNTNLSESYSRQLRKMADLTKKYPKLLGLGMQYTDVFKLKTKIEEVFGSSLDVRKQWE